MKYFKELNKIFKYSKIIKNSFVITFLIIIIDYLNIPTQFIEKDKFLSISVFSFLILLLIFDFIVSKKYSLVKSNNINIFDKNILTFIVTVLIYSLYLIWDFKIYKLILVCISFIVLTCFIILRIKNIYLLLKKQKNLDYNTYDLKDFLDKDISQDDGSKLILFNEVDVKYDLLNRDIFVDYISSLINCCNPQKSFVFALNGAWGSGKTTILNLVKNTVNKEEIIIIDDFDPWKYNDNETLFRGFYDSITKNKNFDLDYSLYKKFYNIYKVLILGNDNILNKVNFDIHFMDNNYSVDELKNIISTYLKLNNKRVVYIIDNIDRLNKEQILIIFKTISTLFDFENFVYILSFDEERVANIFENELKIDSNYLNKIINSNIHLPRTNPDTISKIATDTIMKLCDYYKIVLDNSGKSRFLRMFSHLSKKFNDIRELKRFFNYISAYIQSHDIQEQVNIGDFIIIQLLKYLNINLYDIIYSNPMFFVSEDVTSSSIYSEEYLSADKFNTMSKEFYKELFSTDKNEEYKQILSMLFPYIYNYLNGYEIRSTIPFNHDQIVYNDSIINKRIFNGRYFEHYFELTPNEYSNLLKDVNEFIENVNSTDDVNKIDLYYRLFLISDTKNQKFKLEILNKSLNKINGNIIECLIDVIYNNINNISVNSNGATMLGTRERCILILSDVLNIINIDLAKEKINTFITQNNNLRDIDNLIYWLNPEKQYQRNLNEELYDFTKDKFVDKLNAIIDKNIDVITNYEYGKFTILIFKKYSIEMYKIKKYIKLILNKTNIFKFLRNFIGEWIGAGYSYEFNEKELYEHIPKEDIDKIIDSIDYELSFDQQRILDIYNKTTNSEENFSTSIDYEKI